MMEEVLSWLQHSESPWAYAVLAASAGLEYLFPPLPGDTIALFGIVLAATAGYSMIWVYVSLNVGALVGGMTVYGIGRWIGAHREQRTPRFLRSQQMRHALDSAISGFERHGSIYLALNRFIPAMRGVFFLAAGIARVPAWKVAMFGLLGAMLWNALMLALGWIAGANFERLQSWVSTYTYAALAVTALVALVVGVRWWRGRRSASSSSSSPEP